MGSQHCHTGMIYMKERGRENSSSLSLLLIVLPAERAKVLATLGDLALCWA